MRVSTVVAEGAQPDDAPDWLVGRCGPMQEVCKVIGRVASLHAAVLILGETGTGKEMVARAIYHYSRRAAKPFLAINRAAIPKSLLESELFGHEKGPSPVPSGGRSASSSNATRAPSFWTRPAK